MSEINVIATVYPRAGKTDRLVELLNGVSQYVKDNEPGTLRYEVTREVNKKDGVEQVIMLETYKDNEAVKAHVGSEKLKEFRKTLKDEDLLGEPMSLKFIKPAGGFSSRL